MVGINIYQFVWQMMLVWGVLFSILRQDFNCHEKIKLKSIWKSLSSYDVAWYNSIIVRVGFVDSLGANLYQDVKLKFQWVSHRELMKDHDE